MSNSFNRSRDRSIVVFLVFLLLLTSLGAYSLDEKKSELGQVQEELKETSQKIEEAENKEALLFDEIKEADRQMASLEDEIVSLDAALEAKRSERSRLEKEFNQLVRKLKETTAKLESTERKLQSQIETFNQRLVVLYKKGNLAYLDVLLGATDWTDFLTRCTFLNFIVQADKRLIREIKVTKRLLQEQKTQVAEEKQAVEESKARVEAQEREIAALLGQKETSKNQLNLVKRSKQSSLEQVKSDKKSLLEMEEELEATSRELVSIIAQLEAEQKGIGGGTGAFIWPTAGPITSYYGMRLHPILGIYRMHYGIDIGASYGQSIYAVDSGVVIFANWMGGYGLTLIIDHGNGLSTLYAHTSDILVNVGDAVSQGQVVARVGSTGYSTGPHLHFEVRVNGEPQNPLNYLP